MDTYRYRTGCDLRRCIQEPSKSKPTLCTRRAVPSTTVQPSRRKRRRRRRLPFLHPSPRPPCLLLLLLALSTKLQTDCYTLPISSFQIHKLRPLFKSSSTTTLSVLNKRNKNSDNPQEFFEVQQALQTDLRMAEVRQERLQREINDAKNRQRKLREEARMRQQELDQMKRSGLTRNAKRLARRGGPLSDNSLDRERQLLEQELEGILEREKSQKTSRRLGTLGGLAIAVGALWNFVTEPDGVGIAGSSTTTVKSGGSTSSNTNLATNNPQAATLPYLEKKIEQEEQKLEKTKEQLEMERIRAEEQLAIQKARIEAELTERKAAQARDAARLKAEQEKEAARLKAEHEMAAKKMADEQKASEALRKAEEEARMKKLQQEKEAARVKEDQVKETARLKAEQEAVAKKKAEQELVEKKKAVEAEQKKLAEMEAAKKKVVPEVSADKKSSAPALDERKASDAEAARIREIAQQASEKKKQEVAVVAAKPASKPAATTTTTSNKPPDLSKVLSSDATKAVKKDLTKALDKSNKAVKNARKNADSWWSKLNVEEKTQAKAAAALTAGTAAIGAVYSGLRDGTWSSNAEGVAGKWNYFGYNNNNRRRQQNYANNNQRFGSRGPNGGFPGEGRGRTMGNVNGVRNQNNPQSFPGVVGGPVLGADQQDIFSPKGGIFGAASASPPANQQDYQEDMYTKLRREQEEQERRRGKNPFSFSNPFARKTTSKTPNNRRNSFNDNNSFRTPTSNGSYNTNRNTNSIGAPAFRNRNTLVASPSPSLSSPTSTRGRGSSGSSDEYYANLRRQQEEQERRGGFAPSGTAGQNQNRQQQPGGFAPPTSQSPRRNQRQQSPISNERPQPSKVFPPNNRQSPFSNQGPRANRYTSHQQSGFGSPFSNESSASNQPQPPNLSAPGQLRQVSSPFSNQGTVSNRSLPRNNQQGVLDQEFEAGSGPTGGRMPASNFGNPFTNQGSAANPSQRNGRQQQPGLGQGFEAGSGPTGGRVPASDFTSPFSNQGPTLNRPQQANQQTKSVLGRGFAAGNGPTGGNRVPAPPPSGTRQKTGGFSPFRGGNNSPSTAVSGSQGASRGGGGVRNQNGQQQERNGRNQNSPFGGSPGGATAGFSPFGGNSNSNINSGPQNMMPSPGARFGSNGAPPGRQHQQQSRPGSINGAGINGAGRVNGPSINGASQQPSFLGYGMNSNPSNPSSSPGRGSDLEQRRAQEQARRLEEARKEGIEEARREEEKRRQAIQADQTRLRRSQNTNMSDAMRDKALQDAIQASDENYKPPRTVLDAPTVFPLLEQVDGPNLYQYDETEKTYSGRAVKVMAESSLDIPIRVSTPGSIVEYTIEKKSYDFNLGITAKLDQGGTAVVKESSPFDGRQDQSKTITDQVLVGAGSVPCTLNFKFENNNTWILEVTYRVRVIPPPRDILIQGRRRRIKAAIQAVESDLSKTRGQQSDASNRRNRLENEVNRLQSQLHSNYETAATPVGQGNNNNFFQ